ncbi:MAG: polysaccharide deacetylase family protein [Deltaproteobacteria bacterium]|nr:polysaccharide deacetylase family protein [Deltaproteobacteria bacterium]
MKKIATFSFDDGGAGDIDVIRLFDKMEIPATFYLCPALLLPSVYDGMHREEICRLYDGHEVGNHTRTHRWVPDLGPEELGDEIHRARRELQTFFPIHDVNCFAYPAGKFCPRSAAYVQGCGMKYARTCIRGDYRKVEAPDNPLLLPVTEIIQRRSDGEITMTAMTEGLPVHVVSHGWQVRVNGLHGLLKSLVVQLQKSGYELLRNFDFFEETVR